MKFTINFLLQLTAVACLVLGYNYYWFRVVMFFMNFSFLALCAVLTYVTEEQDLQKEAAAFLAAMVLYGLMIFYL